MVLDLARVMARKQERECARLDEFEFRQRARAVRLLAEWVRDESGEATVDPLTWAGQVATRSFDAIAAELRQAVPDVPDARWRHHIRLCLDEARRSLVAEHGDPAPHRLA